MKKKIFFGLLLILLMLSLAANAVALYGYYLLTYAPSADLHLDKAVYSQDEFIFADLSVYSFSLRELMIHRNAYYGNCLAHPFDLKVDGTDTNENLVSCVQGSMWPFGQHNLRYIFSLPDIAPGKHTLQLVDGGRISDTVEFTLTEAAVVKADCYDVTDRASPHCSQVVISYNYESTSLKDEITGNYLPNPSCIRLKEKIASEYPRLKPISVPGKAHINPPCEYVGGTIIYNVEPGDFKAWKRIFTSDDWRDLILPWQDPPYRNIPL